MMQLTSLIKFSSVISFLGCRLHGIERFGHDSGKGAVSRAEQRGVARCSHGAGDCRPL